MPDTKKVNLECFCGKIKGTLKIVKKDLFHAQCLCCDCQNFAKSLENEDKILDSHGATDLLQTYPEYLSFTQGEDLIGCKKLSEKGLYRWHSKCCNAPLGNTPPSSKVPFVGVSTKVLKFNSDKEKDDLIGPVSMKTFGKYAIGEKPEDAHDKFPASGMLPMLRFFIKGMLTGKAKPHAFFKGSDPITKPILVP